MDHVLSWRAELCIAEGRKSPAPGGGGLGSTADGRTPPTTFASAAAYRDHFAPLLLLELKEELLKGHEERQADAPATGRFGLHGAPPSRMRSSFSQLQGAPGSREAGDMDCH